MNHKVLLADDSLTIQKVIKITLANQPYDITDAGAEDELFHQLNVIQPKLVFLDFNLSENHTGYELTAKIKSLLPSTKVLLLLGTFDTVDDLEMEKCGASDKIVKPFDSNKFIAICKQLVDTFTEEDIDYPEVEIEENTSFESEESQWTVSHSTEQSFPDPIQEDTPVPKIKNPLHTEVSDWGMSVPGVINKSGKDDSLIDIPPVIGQLKSLDEHRAQKNESSNDTFKYPDTSDLDYPTIEELTSNAQKSPEKAPEKAVLSKLLSIESFNDAPLELEGNYVEDSSDVSKIEEQIKDEVEENLWKADEFEDKNKDISSRNEEVKNNFKPKRNDFDDSLFKPLHDPKATDWIDERLDAGEDQKPKTSSSQKATAHVDNELLKTEMEEMIKKYVKEYVDQIFQKNTEKIAWEVIPDLAENLIRQELSKISNKILND
jgi:CheY-like chemotaxis protein